MKRKTILSLGLLLGSHFATLSHGDVVRGLRQSYQCEIQCKNGDIYSGVIFTVATNNKQIPFPTPNCLPLDIERAAIEVSAGYCDEQGGVAGVACSAPGLWPGAKPCEFTYNLTGTKLPPEEIPTPVKEKRTVTE